MQWLRKVPTESNRKPIQRQVETTYFHTGSFGYGWGAVLNGHKEAIIF
jgi:hypothetical protein